LVGVVEVPVRGALEAKVHALEAEVAQLQGALTSRIVLEQAKGQLSITHGVAVDAAFETLRSYARSQRRDIHEVADEVVPNGGEFLAPRSRGALATEVHRLLLRAAEAAEELAKLAPTPAVAELKARLADAFVSLAAAADG
jgi:ANTAR domain-containing protein